MSDLRLPEPVSLEVYLDTDNEVTVEVYDPITGNPPTGGVSGWAMRLQLFTSDGTLADTKTTGGGEITVADPAKSFRFTISPDLDGLTLGKGEWWLRRTDVGARVVAINGPLIVAAAKG